MENLVMAVFPVESQAYQAFSELQTDVSFARGFSIIKQAVLVKNQDGVLQAVESFACDNPDYTDDTWIGTLIGGCLGVLGGPIGILLGAGLGTVTGASVDADDIVRDASLLERISVSVPEGSAAILVLAYEMDPTDLDCRFGKYSAKISRFDAATVQDEIEEANRLALEMTDRVKEAMRAERSEARKAKIAARRKKVAEDFAQLVDKIKDDVKDDE